MPKFTRLEFTQAIDLHEKDREAEAIRVLERCAGHGAENCVMLLDEVKSSH